MTSVLNVDTIADKAGTGPVGLTKQHAAKCFGSCDFSTNSTADLLSGSLNASGLTDNGTGDGTIAFINNFNSTTHAFQFNVAFDSGNANDDVGNVGHRRIARSASSMRFVAQVPNTLAADDSEHITFTVHGDLA